MRAYLLLLVGGIAGCAGRWYRVSAPGSPDVTLPLLVANGITGIRDMGSSDLGSILALRREIRSRTRLGPRMLVAGPRTCRGQDCSSCLEPAIPYRRSHRHLPLTLTPPQATAGRNPDASAHALASAATRSGILP